MRSGRLSQQFLAVAAKYLAAVDANRLRSNQHEVTSWADLRAALGVDGRTEFDALFLYLSDEHPEPPRALEPVTWYDAREKARLERGVERSEWRLYYPDNEPINEAQEGDLFLVARGYDDQLLIIIAQRGSSWESQVRELFHLDDIEQLRIVARLEEALDDVAPSPIEQLLLSELGIEISAGCDEFLEPLIKKFDSTWPKTDEFSQFARSTLVGVDPKLDPDSALLDYWDREYCLFRSLERHILVPNVASKAEAGDIDGVLKVAMSAFQRRKSRAGLALQHHARHILSIHGIKHDIQEITENKAKPDFVFPGISDYRDDRFPSDRLTMLAAKTTCKERWNQILNEAARISTKHLLTLEPGVSADQITKMARSNVSLVVPGPLHDRFPDGHRPLLLTFRQFIELARDRQAAV